jgi:hypothetical protein
MLYSQAKKMKGMVKAEIIGVGDATFTGPANTPQYFIGSREGKGSGAVATFLGPKGTRLTLDQLKKVAHQVASGLYSLIERTCSRREDHLDEWKSSFPSLSAGHITKEGSSEN